VRYTIRYTLAAEAEVINAYIWYAQPHINQAGAFLRALERTEAHLAAIAIVIVSLGRIWSLPSTHHWARKLGTKRLTGGRFYLAQSGHYYLASTCDWRIMCIM
jgi:hypothetical protein